MKRKFSSLNSDGKDILERRPYKSECLELLCSVRELNKKAHFCNERVRNSRDAQNLLVELQPRISLLRRDVGYLASAVSNALAQLADAREELTSTLVKMKYEISVIMRNIDEIHITGKKPVALRDDQTHRVPQVKRHPIIWNIPHDLLRKLTEYLNQDELFEARGVNRIFYRAFYEFRLGVETQTVFNFRRALKLAQMGRVFKNVEFFYWVMFGEHVNKIPECLNPIHFPALHFLEIHGTNTVNSVNINKGLEEVDKASHPNIRTVQIINCRAELLTDERFPNLKTLICIEKVPFQGCRLSKLQLIKIHDFFPDELENISRETFPSLEKIVFVQNARFMRALNGVYIEEGFREDGVRVIFSDY